MGFAGLSLWLFAIPIQQQIGEIPFGAVHLVLAKLAEIVCGVTIGVSANIGKRLIIEHSGAIVIHGNSVIGDDCIIRQGVTIGNKRLDDPFGAPVIGDRVNVGAGAKILGRVHIGNDVEIGANAVVIHDVPDGAIAVGIPARIIIRKNVTNE